MSINWKVRLRHREFWIGLVGSLGTLIIALADLSNHGDYVKSIMESTYSIVIAVLSVLALLGVVVDPTTEGIGDSDQALKYMTPKPKSRDTDIENTPDD